MFKTVKYKRIHIGVRVLALLANQKLSQKARSLENGW